MAINFKIPQLLMNLLSTLPLYYVNNYHTEIILLLLEKVNDESKREMLTNGGLQTLSRLLNHTNSIIKSDVITIMFEILDTGEFRQTTRTIHPLYSEAKNDGVIFQYFAERTGSQSTNETTFILTSQIFDLERKAFRVSCMFT
ncbi:MAG: hypothetical protein EZS28_026388 [Streblomastix strix]|uniref:Uncharacterized protein n=1 Tax=Streblomastix strix TaxID=222440 RepID=A0A5J4V5A4_9EUKA|nr:MAG: hypothetical protein EZS28_026388 [Streblomastix strix]